MTKDKIDKKLLHIEVKDNGLILSQKVGNKLYETKSNLENNIINGIIVGSNATSLVRYKIAQNNQLRDFKIETHKVIDETKKSVKNALKSDTTVNLTDKQVNQMSKKIDKGLLFLEKSAFSTYQSTLNSIYLKVNSAEELKDQLQQHINSGVNVGVVYQDGKKYKFDSYWEMKTRTDIQNEIAENMVNAGHAGGVIFYIAAFFGDCAKDHVDYQGKIYYDKDWKDNAPKDRYEEIEEYINSKCEMSVQDVMTEKGNFLTTRPNCRHYFQYIDIDSVLGAKTEKQVSKLRDKMDLNFNGKYRPEKYEALQQQRANERKIRAEKEKVSKLEQSLALDVGNKQIRSKILTGEATIRRYQANQRQLEKQYSNIQRSYMREQVGKNGNRASFGLSVKNVNKPFNNYNFSIGQGANDNNYVANHPKPEYIKTIDVNNLIEIESILEGFKNEYDNLKTENAIIISSKGEVYRCYGTKDRLFADTDLSKEVLEGCIFIHNHPKEVTTYSFSNDDLKSFKHLKMKEMYGIDDKFVYCFKRNGKKTKQIDIPITNVTIENFQDWNIRNILKDSDIYYERKTKTE